MAHRRAQAARTGALNAQQQRWEAGMPSLPPISLDLYERHAPPAYRSLMRDYYTAAGTHNRQEIARVGGAIKDMGLRLHEDIRHCHDVHASLPCPDCAAPALVLFLVGYISDVIQGNVDHALIKLQFAREFDQLMTEVYKIGADDPRYTFREDSGT